MQVVTKNPIEEIYCQLIPLRQLRLLVPRVCVAEVIRFAPLEKPWPGPAWLRGSVNWATLRIPVISFEELCGRSHGEPGGRTRIAIYVFNRSLSGWRRTARIKPAIHHTP